MYQHDADGQKRTPLNPGYPHLIVVEGRDDGEFYEKACQFANVSDKIEIRSVGSNTDFGGAIKLLAAVGSHLQTIAILRDSEDDPAETWRSACDCLERAGFPRPIQSGKLSYERDGRRTAALIVPAADVPGAIETVCWSSLALHPLVACVEDFLQCAWANDSGLKPTTQALIDKERIRALLAVGLSSPRPVEAGLRFIEVTRRSLLWDWSHQAFVPILDFVKAVARV